MKESMPPLQNFVLRMNGPSIDCTSNGVAHGGENSVYTVNSLHVLPYSPRAHMRVHTWTNTEIDGSRFRPHLYNIMRPSPGPHDLLNILVMKSCSSPQHKALMSK